MIILYRIRTRKTLDTINGMLDTAIDGGFSENTFDESVLSAAEAKMARFLSVCSASSKTLNEQKDKIKSLISDISHQTKTPIANILLYSQLLSERELPQDCAVCVKALEAQAEKLDRKSTHQCPCKNVAARNGHYHRFSEIRACSGSS
jgi:signal transduction histidine kinase